MNQYMIWKVLAFLEIYYYSAAGLPTKHLFYRFYKHRYNFLAISLMIMITQLFKIVAGCLSVVYLSQSPENANEKLMIEYVVINVLGTCQFLKVSLAGFRFINDIHCEDPVVNPMLAYGESEGSKALLVSAEDQDARAYGSRTGAVHALPLYARYKKWTVFFLKITLESYPDSIPFSARLNYKPTFRSIFAARSKFDLPFVEVQANAAISAAMTIIGATGGMMFSSTESTVKAGKTLYQVGLFLALAAAALVMVGLLYKLYIFETNREQKKGQFNVRPLILLQMVSTVLVAVRLVYAVLASYHFQTTYGAPGSPFSIIFGDWSIYISMAVVEECVALVLVIFAFEHAVYKIY